MGISVQHLRKIWAYEIGDENEAKPSQLAVIAERFGVTIDELLNETDQPVGSSA